MREIGWIWHELQDTPWYVRRFTRDLVCARRHSENERREAGE